MKKALKVVGAVLGVLVLALLGLGYAVFGGNLAVADGAEFGKVRAVKDGFVQAFVLDLGGGQVALVDAGNDPEAKAIKAELARRKLGPEAVKAIFLTHGHGDHTAGVAQFPGAQVYALREEAPVLARTLQMHSPIAHVMKADWAAVKLDHPLADGEAVKLGDLEVRAYAVPGHTPGSAAFLADGVLFLGDSASATSDRQLAPAPWLFSEDQAQNRASLKALAARLQPEAVKVLACAHTGALEGLAPLRALAAAH